MLIFTDTAESNGICGPCGDFQWPLDSFVGVHDDEEERQRSELRLLQGEDDGLLFAFKNGVDAAKLERTLRIAAASAAAAASTRMNNSEATSDGTDSAGAPADFATSASANGFGSAEGSQHSATLHASSKRQRTSVETGRMRKGRELRQALSEVASLLAHDKSKQAKEALSAIEPGPVATKGLAKVRAGEMRNLLFTFGGLNLTKAVLDRFLSMPEVKRLLDDSILKSRQELTDAKTSTAMLQAAKRFLNEMLASSGRRSDIERNAFWASVVSLMPSDLTENRQGRGT